MPAHITHSAFGAAVLRDDFCKVSQDGLLVCGVPLSRSSFEWGLQGPDLLFFSAIAFNKQLPQLGSDIHAQKNDELFFALQEYAIQMKETPDFQVAYSYILGFACHYVLDKNCHPYVYFLQRQIEESHLRLHSVHNKIESDIDSAIARRRLGITPSRFRFPCPMFRDNFVYLSIARLYSYIFKEVYDVLVPELNMLDCFSGGRRYFRLVIDRFGLRFLARIIDAVMGKRGLTYHMMRVKRYSLSYMNDEHLPWCNLHSPEQTRTDSFDELFDASVPEAREMIRQIIAHIIKGSANAVTFGETFDNGCFTTTRDQ